MRAEDDLQSDVAEATALDSLRGVAKRVTQRDGPVRLTGEVFANDASVSRDFVDVVTGEVFREVIDLDGVGARAGLSWGW